MFRIRRGALAAASSLSLVAGAAFMAPAASAATSVDVFQNPATVMGTGSASGSAGSAAPGVQYLSLEVKQESSGVGIVSVADSAAACKSPGDELEVTWSNFDTGDRGTFEVDACGTEPGEPGERVEFGSGPINFSTRVLGPLNVQLGSAGTIGSLVPSAYLSGNGSFTLD
ncbi:MAG TPA: hypothetical protein K8V11_02155 [Dietzia timorensis]|uniref:Uncharacterized protein n=1 Tax=Dietzia timorensis TaxID=499555 RepID=A0A921F3F0_9ACTN|nr:hypothetical protein [Dietzia timorensis]HJE89799.1 hypothetical protein [Dietzia timorensis]